MFGPMFSGIFPFFRKKFMMRVPRPLMTFFADCPSSGHTSSYAELGIEEFILLTYPHTFETFDHLQVLGHVF
jgi:hypothetical protein